MGVHWRNIGMYLRYFSISDDCHLHHDMKRKKDRKENKNKTTTRKKKIIFLYIADIYDCNLKNKSHFEEKWGIVTLTSKNAGDIGYYTDLTYCQ